MTTLKIDIPANMWTDVTTNAALQVSKTYTFSNPSVGTLYFWESTSVPTENVGIPLTGNSSLGYVQGTDKVYATCANKDQSLVLVITDQ